MTPPRVARYSSGGQEAGAGTVGPEQHWHDDEFLLPVIQSLEEP
jgi:hypothetical protein